MIFTLSDGEIYEYDDMGAIVLVDKPAKPTKPPPEVPFEVHNPNPVDPARCAAATKALCS